MSRIVPCKILSAPALEAEVFKMMVDAITMILLAMMARQGRMDGITLREARGRDRCNGRSLLDAIRV